MSNRRLVAGLVSLGLAATWGVTSSQAAAYLRPGATERVSVSSTGVEGNGDSPIPYPSTVMTPDGRYVVFSSGATTLVPGYGNNTQFEGEVYVRDRQAHTTRIVSIVAPGPLDKGKSPQCATARDAAISDNGRYIAFAGKCTLPGEAAPLTLTDVFVRDMVAGTTTRVSVSTAGDVATPLTGSSQPTISADGRVVAFTSSAQNFIGTSSCGLAGGVPGTKCYQDNVYVHDMLTRKTKLVSATPSGTVGNGGSSSPGVSPDGRFVAFTSAATDLTPGDANLCPLQGSIPSCGDVYLTQVSNGHTELISVGLPGTSGQQRSGSTGLAVPQAISADDRYVVFRSAASSLVPSTPVNYEGSYVRDRLTQRTSRMTVQSDGTPLPTGDGSSGLSRTGRFAIFDNFHAVNGCPNGVPGSAVHDNLTGATVAVAGCSDGAGSPAISAAGTFVAFCSNSSTLVKGDNNSKSDVFVRYRGRDVGTGAVGRGSPKLVGARQHSDSAMLMAADPAGDAATTLALSSGADLIDASIVDRPATQDMFVRLQVQSMPLFELADPSLVYVLDLTAGSTRYELRAGKVGALPSFALFRADGAGWTHVSDLAGGYGTTGQEVVVALPTAAVGVGTGGRVTDLRAVTGVGSVATGIVRLLDEVTL
jgi:Tol biopolymer transport system component